MIVVIAALASLTVQAGDTSIYADSATARLVAIARARHAFQDTLVHDYQAMVRTRIDAGVGRSRFAHILPIVATETAAEVTWARPNDLLVRLLGTRAASVFPGADIDQTFRRPWFIPRGLGDAIRFSDADLPETAAIHPLAPNAEEFYRYAIFDSLKIELPGKVVRAIGVRVEPRRMAPALVAGNLWLDGETAEVVRFTFLFVGEFLWERPDSTKDSATAKRESAKTARILKVEADLEYALHESRYWMPHRQLVTLLVDIPVFISAHVPVRFLTTFSDYQINTGVTPHFTADPDAVRRNPCRPGQFTCPEWQKERQRRVREGYTRARRWDNGRWEMNTPPHDSLLAYQWPDPLALEPDPAAEQLIRETTNTLAKVGNKLPASWIGRQDVGVAFERASDLIRYNRVQGLSLGGGYQVRMGDYSSLLATARFGLSDRRPTGSLTWRRDAPRGRLDVAAWRSVREAEPWTSGLGFGNSINALFGAHDNADYLLSLGGGASFLGNVGLLRDLELDLRVERLRSISTAARSAVNDLLGGSGVFQFNPPVVEGDFVGAAIRRRWVTVPLELSYGAEGQAGIGDGAAGLAGGRVWAASRLRVSPPGLTIALRGRTGAAVGDTLPQLFFRAGGPGTVRGYTYGSRVGRSGWAVQLDVSRNRKAVSPVFFVDLGNTFGAGDPLVGAGAGLSFFGGLMRLDFAKGLRPATSVRCELTFRSVN